MIVKPLSILIVDDELPLRQELRMFPWKECDAVLMGEASNGEEALQLCSHKTPDVVITDITMPVMDGITLIREMKKRYPSVQIILLTCHSDFHYVQEALRLGALEYILKVSMEEEELMQAMDKVRAVIVKERIAQENEKRERRLLQSVLFGKLLLGQKLSSSDWHPIALSEEKPVLLARIFFDVSPSVYLSMKQQIQQTFSNIESSDSDWLTWLTVRDKEYFILIEARSPSEMLKQSFGQLLQSLTDLMKLYSPLLDPSISAHAIISEPITSGEELAHALVSLTEWKNALFYDHALESNVFFGEPQPLADMKEQQVKELIELLRKSSWSTESLKEFLQGEFMLWCFKHRIKPEQLKERVLNWQVEWLKVQENANLDGSSIANLMGAHTLSQMVACIIQDITAIELGRTHSRFEIRSAVQWIKDHLEKPISLPHIAEQVGLSPHYVSKLFREETGSSFNQYITKLRMEKAVELLKHTNKKVYEIAEEVGIPSYRYFTVTFRNWTGVSPTDFKRHS
ncbi:DNA-binding response regulator [Paenibacillus sp. FSL H8-0548]|uniref:response regulator transcription factor n=1 Tax=Paenibacillus sp. FSL H8-0548 TaxID=1920422 RepID=UPI00096DF7FC|nr:response regulator [Paenibacillus sp. FSL H8-0548]OMF38084.1 DNA-binding response regulator [Paenibacillus sp. FSL H8-0548]